MKENIDHLAKHKSAVKIPFTGHAKGCDGQRKSVHSIKISTQQ